MLQGPSLDEEHSGDIADMLQSQFMGLHMGPSTLNSEQTVGSPSDLTPSQSPNAKLKGPALGE